MSTKEKDEQHEQAPYEIFSSTIGTRYDIYLSSYIDEPHKYTRLLNLIRGLGDNDQCNLILNTPGGQCVTGVQIISAISDTRGHVHTIAEGDVSSMGALIFMAGHQMSIEKYSNLLFHNASWGFVGKGHEMTAHTSASTAWYEAMMRDLTLPFLEPSEIDRILSGLEFYLTAEQVRSRFPRIGEMQGDSVLKYSTLEKWNPEYVRPSVPITEAPKTKKKHTNKT